MGSLNKFVCIHGHFYQPPRENAWLEEVEIQDSASPFHDWNERINFECYAPNTASRILDEQGYISKIINNYSRISYNFGPTLLSWLAKSDPETYKAIIDADRISQERFGGHGSALAQVHGHLILPLANQNDKETQVIWGIKDFEHRFGRKPEGIWLSETAVNTETLEVLAANDLQFTILAPRQAKAFRPIGEKDWTPVNEDTIDTRRPYRCLLPSGKSIVLFFYHRGISQGVAFEGLLNNGKNFAYRFINSLDDNAAPQLAHIATDGESYGHHHAKGEMALADCLNQIEAHHGVQLSNYGQFLEKFPPEFEAQIHENSSWSCVHGIERWRSNCGCNTGGNHGWNQEWRGPLRDALDWLRDKLIPAYEQGASKLVKSPWDARNDYISVVLDRSDESIDNFIKNHAKKKLNKKEKTQLLRLMEMQRQAMQMYTSCGWFFDEISGIETDQILQYANRAISYAKQVAGIELHNGFVKKLKKIPSNVYENGAGSYQKNVMPAQVDLVRVGMHYAASSLFEKHPDNLEFFNYIANSEVFKPFEAGLQKLAVGRTIVKSKITHSEKHFSFVVLYLGQQNLIGYISIDMDQATFDKMVQEVELAFKGSDLSEVIGIMQTYFGSDKFSVWHLFRDEKRKILRQITGQSLLQAERAFRDIYNDYYQLMTGTAKTGLPIPEAYKSATQFIVNHDFQQFFENGHFYVRELERLVDELKKWDINFKPKSALKLAASERLFNEIKKIKTVEDPETHLENLNTIIKILNELGFELNTWKSQNLYFNLLQANQSNGIAEKSTMWKEHFSELGSLLQFKQMN